MEKWFSAKPCKSGRGHTVLLPLSSFSFPDASSPLDYIAAVYSSVPMGIVLLALAYGAWKRIIEVVSFLLLFLVHWPVTSILKLCIQQSRPLGSCSYSYGMPSGHAFASVSTFVYLSLTWLLSKQAKVDVLKVFLIGMILLPVGWSRVHLQDHSVAQVVVGSSLGAAWGGLWFMVNPWLTAKLRAAVQKLKC